MGFHAAIASPAIITVVAFSSGCGEALLTDYELLECQNSDEPCPAPMGHDSNFCCPIDIEASCGCTYDGGAYAPDGTLGRSKERRGGVCDAKWSSYRVVRDEFGCLSGRGVKSGSCLGTGRD